MTEFVNYALGADTIDEAAMLGIQMPEVAVSSTLRTRLSRDFRTLEVNDWALFDGVREAECERPIRAQIDSLPKDAKKPHPQLVDFKSGGFDRHYTFTMAVSPKSVNVSQETLQNINKIFWRGVLGADYFAEQDANHKPSAPEGLEILARDKYWLAAYLAGNTAVSGAVETVFSIQNTTGQFCTTLAMAFATYPTINAIKKRVRSETHGLNKKLSKRTIEFSKEFPVLSFGVAASS